ncbi:Bacterial Ig-like domain (group 2) [compost metagenome]
MLKFTENYSDFTPQKIAFDSNDYSVTLGQTLDTVIKAYYGDRIVDVRNDVTLSSDDEAVVSIDGQGNITGLQSGETTIRAVYKGLVASAKVIVF